MSVYEKEFSVELTVALPANHVGFDKLTDALFDAGFDDASVGTGRANQLGVAVTRPGHDAKSVSAETSARVLKALPVGCSIIQVFVEDSL